ncbi:hypothetical protein SEA_JINKIES_68 [Arthrobacter phage Jinkies]|uniref:HTH cro/C1-type domain-containing protein n=1 Tax=Arthrobacter phage Jinkies TaxID=2743903 RepID=A0A7T0NAY6_9CAUD|nr:hypothetical protein SEA_JINKIES_68 [Arthrobacter phage Jinkies]
MPKQTYIPTEADRLTGQNVRRLRRLAGETLQQTIDRSGINLRQSSLSRVELGQRQLTTPEATKLAAHFNTTVDKIIVKHDPIEAAINAPTLNTTVSPAVPTEQEWLGNDKPGLFAVPEPKAKSLAEQFDTRPITDFVVIDRDAPLTPDEYRDQVWIPYLEQRYAAELKQTG